MHWSRKCRCSGIPGTNGTGWCGNRATEEDGLCVPCREVCIALGDARVLTMTETRDREPWEWQEAVNE